MLFKFPVWNITFLSPFILPFSYFPMSAALGGLKPSSLGWWGKCSTTVLPLLPTYFFGVVVVFFGIFWYYLVLFGIIWHYLLLFGIIWYFLVFFGIFWYFLVFFGIFWYFLVFFGIFWYFLAFLVFLGFKGFLVFFGIFWYYLVCFGILGIFWYFLCFKAKLELTYLWGWLVEQRNWT